MRMNRRNVLVGLGTIVAGGGAALGTGAFSSVSADRTVTVDTSGDGSAHLGITVSGDYATNDGGDIVEINLGSDYNDNATTTISNVLTLTLNESAANDKIKVSVGDGSHSDSTKIAIDGAEVTFTLNDTDENNGDGSYATIGKSGTSAENGTEVTISADIDTTVAGESGDSVEPLTLYATEI